MSDSSIVVLNSKYRTLDSASSSNFTISIGQSISIKQIVVKSVSLPNTFYNITDTNNVGIINLTGLGTYIVLVPVGQYTLATFLTQLQTLLTAIDIASTVVQNPLTKKLEFTFSYLAQWDTSSASPLSRVMGTYLQPATVYPAVPVASFSAAGFTDLSGIRNVFICSRILGQGFNSILQEGRNLPMILNMPMEAGFGDVCYYSSNEVNLDLKQYKSYQNIQLCDLTLRGDDGELLNNNGAEWSITLLVYYEKIIK